MSKHIYSLKKLVSMNGRQEQQQTALKLACNFSSKNTFNLFLFLVLPAEEGFVCLKKKIKILVASLMSSTWGCMCFKKYVLVQLVWCCLVCLPGIVDILRLSLFLLVSWFLCFHCGWVEYIVKSFCFFVHFKCFFFNIVSAFVVLWIPYLHRVFYFEDLPNALCHSAVWLPVLPDLLHAFWSGCDLLLSDRL